MDTALKEHNEEVKDSSTVRLVRELTRWDWAYHEKEMEAIVAELKQRKSEKEILKMLFLICLIVANFGTTWSEHFYVFDEDEAETKRQLKLGVQTHLWTLVFICLSVLLHPVVPIVLLVLYIGWTVKWAFDWYLPIKEKINTTANNA